MVFIIAVYVYYGDIRLGAPGSKPEYNDLSWFTMLFACGVSTGRMCRKTLREKHQYLSSVSGLFFFGVAEPVWHYTSPSRYSADPTLPDNTLAQVGPCHITFITISSTIPYSYKGCTKNVWNQEFNRLNVQMGH